jgi:hypothetical protein
MLTRASPRVRDVADQTHDFGVTTTNLSPPIVRSSTDRATVPHESVAELRVHYDGPAEKVGQTVVASPAANEAGPERMTALFGIHRDDGVWVTECAWCKRVRSVAGDWHTLSATDRSAIHAERTHGICFECADRCIEKVGGAR